MTARKTRFNDPPGMKTCHECLLVLPVDMFHKNKSNHDGLQRKCKECVSAYNKTHYDENKDKFSLNHAKWRAANPGYFVMWRNKNPNYSKNYHRQNIQLRSDQNKAWRAKNPDYHKEWRKNNPLRVLEQDNRRRAREMGAEVVGRIDREEIIRRDRSICYICGEKVQPSDVHLDHVVPLSRGGWHVGANLRVTHSWCNQRKGAKLPEEIDSKVVPVVARQEQLFSKVG